MFGRLNLGRGAERGQATSIDEIRKRAGTRAMNPG
jgi:hypothetical protein